MLVLTPEQLEYKSIRFNNNYQLKTSNALVLHELADKSLDVLIDECQQLSEQQLSRIRRTYVPEEYIKEFSDTNLIPMQFLPKDNELVLYALEDLGIVDIESLPNLNILYKVVYTDIIEYFTVNAVIYGKHICILPVPAVRVLENIISEAVKLGAADITISTEDEAMIVYYNVRKKRIDSNIISDKDFIEDVIKTISIKSPYPFRATRKPYYLDVDLNEDYRGRVIVVKKHVGYTVTIRLLPNASFSGMLDNWNLTSKTVSFIRDKMLNSEYGLRVLAGPTMSGKNTTILAATYEVVEKRDKKVISVEMPVELKLPGVEQLSAESIEEYSALINSCIHQNPDFLYITEMKAETALETMYTFNTGKAGFSTIHANGVADVIPRIQDLTGLSTDRIIMTLHSIMFQKLVRDDETDTVRPVNSWIYLTDELKEKLYNQPLGEILRIIKKEEEHSE